MTRHVDRQRLIKLIHVAKRDLALDDDSYRTILQRIGKKTSAADLTVPELEKVLEHMKRSGFKVRSKKGDRPQASDDQSKMIRGLWLELAGMEVVRNSSEAALGAFVKRMAKVDTLQWLSTEQASQVIEHLKEWRERVTKQRRAQLVKAMGLAAPTSIEALAAQEEQLRDAAGLTLGRKASVGDMTETEFQTVLRHFAKEGI
ncbi:regulatory protein GemA [Laribacter hongkongensis]|uniref:gp16 family protein n=1 Tax=Laribacter hongkongensis TaxID=168471 RepID=UPI001EFE3E21|nr:regulatory protein GemA [Laribacter hongkongensis]MCG8991482.1 regulatory protein GemA [Laribacter hongkongensis]MCG8997738.1 regulatory protein GemA [Laribacter hongkongensis]MCG9001236.1 regulatory protein GemA [Laribacter hongkongensis]MCG9003068.1 regulatory protein GemA [Laribacter hongkongensis]MCG9007444.1 regulatory protein GemA [Laribacter hongkongensis]